MKALAITKISDLTKDSQPLSVIDLPEPTPGEKEILIKIRTCGVCHTEIDEIEGRTPPASFPMVPGHQAVGIVEQTGPGANVFKVGDRVGVGWIHSACGKCKFCLGGDENLCPDFKATGRDVNGGYSQYMKAPEDFAHPIPEVFSDAEAAPLLCAGAIGHRSLRLTGLKDGQSLGLSGFGASAHLVLKMVKHQFPNSEIFVFARNGKEREFAKELGAVWAGDTEDPAPVKLAAVIDTTPAWKPVVEALKNLDAGGRLVINAIRKEEKDKDCLLKLDYPAHLWLEKEIKSVANVARRDIREFLTLAAEISLKPETQLFALEEANQALAELKTGKIRGAKALQIS